MFSHIKKITAIYWAVIFFIILDRLFKALAVFGYRLNIAGEFLKFSFTKNYYIAFSLPFFGVWLNTTIALIILALVYYLVTSWKKSDKIAIISLSAVILGAVSNFFDRLKYGYVIDYFDLKYFTVFNLADAMILSGAMLLLILVYKKEANK